MAYQFNGTNQYLTAPGYAADQPLTLACWSYIDDSTKDQRPFSIDKETTIAGYFLRFKGSVSPKETWMVKANDVDAVSALIGFNYSNSTWLHAAGTNTSNTARKVFLNGTNSATNAITLTSASGTMNYWIGAFNDGGTLTGYFKGRVASCAFWSAALTDDEIVSLARGFKPHRVRPQSLKFFAPLIRNLQDLKEGATITNNNSATVADHPRVY